MLVNYRPISYNPAFKGKEYKVGYDLYGTILKVKHGKLEVKTVKEAITKELSEKPSQARTSFLENLSKQLDKLGIKN